MLTARQGLLALVAVPAVLYGCWFLIVEKPQADRAAAFKADMLKQVEDVNRQLLFKNIIAQAELDKQLAERRRHNLYSDAHRRWFKEKFGREPGQ